jgi:hypothetical protein
MDGVTGMPALGTEHMGLSALVTDRSSDVHAVANP